MLNEVTIMGRITRDIELKKVNDASCVNFTVAVDRDYTASDGARETDFIDCNAWRGTADFVNKYFAKGSQIAVCGRMQSRKFVDADGKNRTAWFIQVANVYFVGAAKKSDEKPQPEFSELPDADDLPF